MSEPLFSVIVPTFQRNDLLAGCLEKLAPGVQKMTRDQYEVIVTDDGRASTAQEMVSSRFPWARWVQGPARGPAANRNTGVKFASGRWLAFTDDDCLPDPDWLTGFRDAIATNPAFSVFEGTIYAERPRRSLAEIAPVNEKGGYLWASNFAIAAGLFREIGGFDERFRAAMEDVDLRQRLECAGRHALFLPSARVCHPWRLRTARKDGWKNLGSYATDTVRYLDIHPEEAARLNALYFCRSAVRAFCLETLPGAFRFKGRGIREALIQHAEELRLAFVVFRRERRRARC